MAMTTARLLNQNVYYYIVNQLAASWSNVRVLTSAPEDVVKLTLPTVAIVPQRTTLTALEIGSSDQVDTDLFVIQAYCKSDGQRDDLGDFLKNLFTETSTDFLDYNDGFPPATGQTVLGKIDFKFISMNPVRILGSPHPAERHRMDIRMSTEIIGL